MEHSDVFDKARRLYPGTRRGNETEFANFTKKHKDWKEVLPLLYPAIQNQINWRQIAKSNGLKFIRCWKMFQTWTNQRCWEEEPDEEIARIVNKIITKQETIKKVQAEEPYLAYTLECIQHENPDMIGKTRNTWLKPPRLANDELLTCAETGRRQWEQWRGGKWKIVLPEECLEKI